MADDAACHISQAKRFRRSLATGPTRSSASPIDGWRSKRGPPVCSSPAPEVARSSRGSRISRGWRAAGSRVHGQLPTSACGHLENHRKLHSPLLGARGPRALARNPQPAGLHRATSSPRPSRRHPGPRERALGRARSSRPSADRVMARRSSRTSSVDLSSMARSISASAPGDERLGRTGLVRGGSARRARDPDARVREREPRASRVRAERHHWMSH